MQNLCGAMAIAIVGFSQMLAAQTALEAARIAPAGILRVTFLGGNPVQGRIDPQTGAVSGPVADITKELARRLGVPFQISPANGARAVLDSVLQHNADIGFLAFDASRATEVDFSKPYELAYNTYLVPSDSPLQSVATSDREGVRIAAVKGDSGELFLERTLRHAELKGIPALTVDQARTMLEDRQIDAFAANRQRLVEESARRPGVRVLPDNFFAVEQSLIVQKGDGARLASLNRFLDDLRASGFLKAAIERARLSGVEPAPPK
jgi:polar amino acid transport system substrate-binding protein